MPRERERRFLVRHLPENYRVYYDHAKMRQGYVAITDDREVRIREKVMAHGETTYDLEVKVGSGEVREDPKASLTQEEFEQLWSVTEGRRVFKTRYFIPYGDLMIELDIFEKELTGYIHVEVEFDDEAQSAAFVPPDWFGKEVTEDPRHNGKNLVRCGAPRDHTSVPTYDLADGVAHLIRDVQRHWAFRDQDTGTIVLIAGGSASGKTSAVAKRVKDHFEDDALIVSMDDYYRGATFVKEHGLNFDQPEALDLELLAKHLIALKRGEAIEKPVYSFKTGEREGYERVEPKPIIILEGLFALSNELSPIGNVRVFVDIGMHGRIIRRLLRDVSRSSWGANEILGYFAKVVEPMHDKYIESTRRNADIVIRNEYNPAVEAARSGLHEFQLKFRGTVDEQILRAAGAERIASVMQRDTYYNPPGKDLKKTGEMLRIREESDRIILTYKGPYEPSKFRQRPKFECEIDKATRDGLLTLYADIAMQVTKQRTLYVLPAGIVVALDDVEKTDANGTIRDLRKFVELRTSEITKESRERFVKAAAALGLNERSSIITPYMEM